MELIKTDTDYAMRLLVHLAADKSGQPLSAKKLARDECVPESFAYKILGKLTKAGLTARAMGPRGGFTLARSPEKVDLLDVANAVQGRIVTRHCALGGDKCPRQGICPVSGKLQELQQELVASMKKVKLADFVQPAGQDSPRAAIQIQTKSRRKVVEDVM